jgi:dTDP-4-dehydrorhamnose reductase
MKILILGSNGQLGKEITNFLQYENTVQSCSNLIYDNYYCDLLNSKSIEKIFNEFKPNYVINCAAYTDVDRCEIFKKKAYLTNFYSLRYIIKNCKKNNTILIHFSTDYLFDGQKIFYKENSKPIPLNYYGKTKFYAEEIIKLSNINYIIFRICWVHSKYKKNFISYVINQIKNNNLIELFNNEHGSPSSSIFVAKNIKMALDFLKRKKIKEIKEIFNLCTKDPSSREDIINFIYDIFKISSGRKYNKLIHLKNNYLYLAERPKYSMLDVSKFEKYFLTKLPSWREDLSNYIYHYEK